MNRTARVLELLAGIVSLASGIVLLDKLTDGWVYEQWERRTEPARRYVLLLWDACWGAPATIEDAERITRRPWWQRGF